jgi:hypothetical protein
VRLDLWPDCPVPGCPNKVCLRLKSPYCYPHTYLRDFGQLRGAERRAVGSATNAQTLSDEPRTLEVTAAAPSATTTAEDKEGP